MCVHAAAVATLDATHDTMTTQQAPDAAATAITSWCSMRSSTPRPTGQYHQIAKGCASIDYWTITNHPVRKFQMKSKCN